MRNWNLIEGNLRETHLFLVLLLLLVVSCGKMGNREADYEGRITRVELGSSSPNPKPATPDSQPVSLQDVIAELRNLEAPQGLSRELFSGLKLELERALMARGVEKFPSKPPAADMRNSISLVTDVTGLTWNEARSGDWNNDGAVTASDLSPLAFNFGKSDNPGDQNYYNYALYIDGNSDGTVNAGDLSPIAFHFGESTGGYNIYEAEDSSGTGKIKVAEITRPPVPVDNENPPTNSSFATLQYDTATGEINPPGWIPIPGKWYRVVPFDNTPTKTESTDVLSSWVELPLIQNQPPVAVASANPTSGPPPLTVNFSATGSSDPDGTIVLYEWDFESDETYDYSDPNGGDTQHTYDTRGSYNASLRVIDDRGVSGLGSVTVSVNSPPIALLTATPSRGPAPLSVQLDATASSDQDGAIVSYEFDFTDDGVVDETNSTGIANYSYSRAGYYVARVKVIDDEGASGLGTANIYASGVRIDTIDTDTIGAGSGVDFDSGNNPVVAFYKYSTPEVMVARYYSGQWIKESIEVLPEPGSGSMDVAVGPGDRIYVSYYTNEAGGLKMATGDGSSWKTETVDNQGWVGWTNDIDIDSNGNPVIGYAGIDPPALCLARFDSGSGTWNITKYSLSSFPDFVTMDLDSQDNVWFGYKLNTFDNYAAFYDGVSWSEYFVETGWRLFLAVDPQDVPWVLLESGTGVMRIGRWTGTDFLIVDFLDGAYFPSMAFDSKGGKGVSLFYLNYLNYAYWDGTTWKGQFIEDLGSFSMGFTKVVFDGRDNPGIAYLHDIQDATKFAWIIAP